uniref:Uncharacterized protein n=1 Tax=Meloidogyne javanica TaxID=6303 RepID=A0A915MTM3_MELJA
MLSRASIPLYIAKRSKATSYQYAVHPVTGKKPPTLEEFDPINPGEWQIGVGGKMLPRLPEGTRCGELVMGKYGLYDPKVRKLQDELWAGTAGGTLPTETANYPLTVGRNIVFGMVCCSVVMTLHAMATLLFSTKEKPLWPYKSRVQPE